ncbi:signal peptidase II [Desulfonauticus submarinus]|uniref:Lipoprotein signal peptidase n=1 Tax=Desulfonauticus submarinus TaxID=206665 RepID=A0A1H0DXQ5_9BACT|nr:signal peptidase II [Desulfonauticus submarinus]SDN74895.1 signal peptidase II [Desulfonauticus submarinus]
MGKFKYKLCFGLAAIILVLDQISKLWIEKTIPLWSERVVVPGFFNLVHILNKGAAFGFLNRADISWQTYFFIGASALAIVLIIHLLKTVDRKDYYLFTGLGLILGGALGNLIDRIRLGKVIDFLDFYIKSYHWPAFNVADIAIFCGTVCLLLSFYKRKKNASNFN